MLSSVIRTAVHRLDIATGDRVDKRHVRILAHNAALCCLSLTNNGQILASASSTGTIIRLWDVDTGRKLVELRRGIHKAIIHSINIR